MMQKLKVYLDTSVISHLFHEDTPEKQKDTIAFWEQLRKGIYEPYLSIVTLDEIEKSRQELRSKIYGKLAEISFVEVDITDEVDRLATKIIDAGILKEKNFNDCRHIAVAIVNRCDCIVSWNFKHLVNYKTINGVKKIAVPEGYGEIEILTPPSLMESEG